MKQLFQAASISLSALFIIGTSSCTKETIENAPVSNETETRNSENRDSGPVFQPAPKYTLIKQGNTELTYYADGKLATMKTMTGTSTYTYGGFGEIYVKTMSGNNVTGLDTFLTNVGDGKCFYSKTKGISYYANGTVTTIKEKKYVYDATGKLVKIFNPAFPNERTEFTYNADGNMFRHNMYSKTGASLGQTNFYYVNAANQTIIDKYPINPSAAGIDEPYLKIFGKFSKLLAAKTIHLTQSGSTDYTYEYTFNADNYVTERKTFTPNSGLIQTTPFVYQVN